MQGVWSAVQFHRTPSTAPGHEIDNDDDFYSLLKEFNKIINNTFKVKIENKCYTMLYS